MCLKLITDDLFDIANRLKSVNNSYVLYFNTQNNRFEVHDGEKRRLELVVPYDELDARTVEYARYTSVENAKRLFAEMEAHNQRLEKKQISQAVERAAVAIEDGRRFNEG